MRKCRMHAEDPGRKPLQGWNDTAASRGERREGASRPGASDRFDGAQRRHWADSRFSTLPIALPHRSSSFDLRSIAARRMHERGLASAFTDDVLGSLQEIQGPGLPPPDGSVRDLRPLRWISIDNGRLDPTTRELVDASRDLDQITYAERLANGNTKVLVAVADVDALAPKGSAIDAHSGKNTRTVYTAAGIFPMIPERLSTDLTSLNEGQDRLAIVTEMEIAPDGSLVRSEIYRGFVHNHAKLAYDSVAAWLGGEGPTPRPITEVAGVADQIRLQDQVAQSLRARRKANGALELASREARAVVQDGRVQTFERHRSNAATQLIEELMVAANGVTARFLESRKVPYLQRVVKDPEKWDRIRALASELGEHLPSAPSSKALSEFLDRRRALDPDSFPDLSLAVVKLMGRGEYVVHGPGRAAPGHFGLAVGKYAHSTAPNRRRPDLIVQRQIKAALAGRGSAYTFEELEREAELCTMQESAADKVERHLHKSAVAIHLQNQIGRRFDAVVTGASQKGTWARISNPEVEGKVVSGGRDLAVGRRIHVKLVAADVENGFIDFVRCG